MTGTPLRGAQQRWDRLSLQPYETTTMNANENRCGTACREVSWQTSFPLQALKTAQSDATGAGFC